MGLSSEHYFDDIVFQRLMSGDALPYPVERLGEPDEMLETAIRGRELLGGELHLPAHILCGRGDRLRSLEQSVGDGGHLVELHHHAPGLLAEELELCPGLGDEAVGLAQVALERRRKLRQRLVRLSQRTDEFQRRAQGRDHCGRAALPSLRTFCICHRAILIMSGRLSPSLRTTEGSKPECILQLRQRGSWRVSQ